VAERWESALVTGASSGLGAAMARHLAANGTRRLTLVGRDAQRLQALAGSLGGAEVECVACDLTAAAARDALVARIDATPPDLLVNNAGAGVYGRFDAMTRAELRACIDLNITTLTDLTHAYVAVARGRGRGDVLQVASAVAFVPVPYEAVYAATKSYVVSLSEAVAEEVRGTALRVRCVCPGLIATEFARRAGLTRRVAPVGVTATPERVARAAFATFERSGVTHLLGPDLQLAALAIRFVPRAVVARVAGRWMRRGLAD